MKEIFRWGKEKFYIGKNTKFWSVFSTALSAIIYIFLLLSIESFNAKNQIAPYGFFVARDVSLVVFTILSTTILTTFLIEIRSKNELYKDILLNDILSNPLFYNSFGVSEKEQILRELEKELIFSDSAKMQNMYNSIKRKLSIAQNTGYYYERASFRISCTIDIQQEILVRECVHTTKIRSYADNYSIKNFVLSKWEGINIENCFALKYIELNGRLIDVANEVSVSQNNNESPLGGFTISYIYKLISELNLSRDRDTVIEVSYITRTPLSHNVFKCQSTAPCRHFSVEAFLQQTTDYELTAAAFGFRDSAERSPRRVNKQEIHIEFDDWIFDRDGVVIVCTPSDDVNDS